MFCNAMLVANMFLDALGAWTMGSKLQDDCIPKPDDSFSSSITVVVKGTVSMLTVAFYSMFQCLHIVLLFQ